MALRAVKPHETAPPTTVLGAVENGTDLEVLRATKRRIARAIDDPDIRGADLAALTRRLSDLRKEEAVMLAVAADAEGADHVAPDEEFDASAI